MEKILCFSSDMLEKIRELYSLQNHLNVQTIKLDNWHEGKSLENMSIDWLRYIKLETAELIESFPVKHWKDIKKEIDILNVKIELTDIWHFLLSQIIKLQKEEKKEESAMIFLINESFLKGFVTNSSKSILKLERLEATERFFESAKYFEFTVAYYHLFENDKYLIDDKSIQMKKLILSFCELCNLVELDFYELYKLYIGKNCLNQFRQDYGYKENTYIKIWDEKEDNVVMKEIVYSKEHSFQTLYVELEKVYSQIKR